jgi:2-alkyl-3-oxoalkanoate reductase
MRALVTGAGGFLGQRLTSALVARGDTVRTFQRGAYTELDRLGVEQVRADLRDADAVREACREIDVVFHTAAAPGIWGKWEDFFGVNTLGTRHVLEGCRRHGVGRLIYTSSPSVTFDGRDQCGVDESAPYPTRWLCHYPHSKALAEQEVLAANGEGGLVTCALRPHLIWGPGDRHLIPRLIARARAGRLVQVGGGANLIDTIHIDNCVAAHLAAAERLKPGSPVAGRAYFLSQGEPVRCWTWIGQLLELAGLNRPRRKISARAAWRLGAACEAAYRLARVRSEPPMTRFLAAQLSTSHYFDISAARRDLGYEPLVSTAAGMFQWAGELRRLASE